MGAYIVKRLLQVIPVIIIVTLSVFLMLTLTGDPVRALIGPGETLDEEQIESLRHEMGLDRPIFEQYVTWMGKIIQGDFGRSNRTRIPVLKELAQRIPVTLHLGIAAWLLSVILAIPVGIFAAVRRGSKMDIFTTVLMMGGVAMPGFWFGILLIMFFGVTLGWLPPFGFVSILDDPIQSLRHLALPAFSLGLAGTALNMRQMRSAMLEVLAQDYVRTARAKGLKERTVIWTHALKNAFLPVITLMGLQIGRMLGGAVVIESLFAIPGMGKLIVDSIFVRDFPIVQACALVISLTVVFSNLITDLFYAYLDPRIKYN